MSNYRIIKIQEYPELKNYAANWFHEKWNIPLEAYIESIDECMKNKTAVPQWYIVIIGDKIVGGLGVIENDFHNRKDLTPNVCAVYVEDDYRCQGIAGKMLNYVCDDMKEKNVDTLYLVTDHTSFYERHGWEFLCMVQAEGEKNLTRMYIHRTI
ncbi:GNAT family N-acetyltransferase [uncultured Clostridium sp.]|uniref:GNAT family N-acetyltransferase n=1 Tax=uncultured Clostridium sp. TaxID=59620 RepID=UPI003216E50D